LTDLFSDIVGCPARTNIATLSAASVLFFTSSAAKVTCQ
jgi:hypothetical protein